MSISESLEKIAKQDEFQAKYEDFLRSLLEIRKVASTQNLEITEVTLSRYWNDELPHLEKDMEELGLDKLLGFTIKRPS